MDVTDSVQLSVDPSESAQDPPLVRPLRGLPFALPFRLHSCGRGRETGRPPTPERFAGVARSFRAIRSVDISNR